MSPLDFKELEALLPRIQILTGDIRSIMLLTPTRGEYELFSRFYPNARITSSTINEWDIRNPGSEKYDLIFAASVFMAIADPALCIGNLLDSSKFFIMNDHCRSFRGGGGREITTPPPGERTPDCMRYTMPPEMEAVLPNAFDLNAYRARLLEFIRYSPESNGITFIGLWRGDA